MTVTPLLDNRRKRPDKTYPLIVRIRHGRQTREINTGWKLHESNWKNQQAVKHASAPAINTRIAEIITRAHQYFADCEKKKRDVDLNNIGKHDCGLSFPSYLCHRATQYEQKQMLIMARKTLRIAKEITQCFGRDVFFDELNQDLLRDYETWLVEQGNQQNTRHKKFKFLQQFYSQAVLDGKAQDPNPFKLYKINPKPVRKEKLTLSEIEAIENLPLNPGPVNDARNLFLFSYYAKGARFENCVMFRRDKIQNGRLLFKTNKGNKFISVQIHSRLQAIIDQYDGKPFLFPYVKQLPADKKKYIKMIDSLNVIVNRNLKTVAGLAEITIDLTFHIARHTFAFHLKKVASSIGVISDSLGHSNTRTTEIYLKALDDEFLDGELEKLYGK